MSRQPSPGPSQAHSHGHIFQPVSTPATRQKSRAYATGIAAGAEDVKYQAKYKELKRKVKEIEADNDKLHFKVLQAKRSIQRMKLERAILYERLAAVPPSPELNDRQPLPPMHSGPSIAPHQQQYLGPPAHHSHRSSREHMEADPNDHAMMDYLRTHNNVRVIQGPDGRPVSASDAHMGPATGPLPHNPHVAHSSGRPSGSGGHDSSRQLPPLSQLAPVQHMDAPRAHGHSHSQSSPPNMHSHVNSSHSHSRSHSGSRARGQVQYQTGGPGHSHSQTYPPEVLPPVQRVLRSPPLSSDRSRSRRQEAYELSGSHPESQSHPRLQIPQQSGQAQTQHVHSPTDLRSGRLHHHQRVGPGANIAHSDDHEHDVEREREWEHDRAADAVSHMHSPHLPQRSRQQAPEHQERTSASRARDEPNYYHDHPGGSTAYPPSGRGSGSGSLSPEGAGDGPSRPDSRNHLYARDRTRTYSSRTVHHTNMNDDMDYAREGGRSHSRDRYPPEHTRSPVESRKRSRNDMEVDTDHDVDNGGTSGGGFSGNYPSDDRGVKRVHHDATSTRMADNREDNTPE